MASVQLSEMLVELRGRCPHLCPAVTPAGYSDIEQGTALLALCSEGRERRALAAALSRSRTATGGRCALTGQQVGEGELHFVSMWEAEPEKRAYRIRTCAFVCKQAALLMQPAAFLERFTRAAADTAELTELALLFCRVNEQTSRCEDPLDARLWLQECMNLAYACTVLASSFSTWHVLGPGDSPLASAGSASDIAECLLAGGTANGSEATAASGRKGVANTKAVKAKKRGKGDMAGEGSSKKQKQRASDA